MDRKKTKKIQNTRIVMTNIFMGLSVVAIVFILMLIAMGFSFNENGGLEQSGLLQISSRPSGATVEIDGETQFSRTEISKMLGAGDHKIKVTRSGYDTWESTVRVDAGLLTHISWVRLFPLNPTVEKVGSYRQARLISFSNDRKNLLYGESNSSKLRFIGLQGNSISESMLNLSDILGLSDLDTLRQANISVVSWNDGGNKVILNYAHDGAVDWILADLEKPEKSINLSAKYGLVFSKILIANSSASKLWGVENGNLHLIDLGNSTISAAKITGVQSIANNKDVVAYLRTSTELDANGTETTIRTLETFKEGETGATIVTNFENQEFSNFTLALGTYWSEEWLAYSTDAKLTILAGKYPSYDKPTSNALKIVLKREISHVPVSISHSNEQRIVAFRSPDKVMSFDFETKDYYDIKLKSTNPSRWLDDYIIWQHEEGKVTINDFNGANYRELIAESNNELPVCLSENSRWLYYFDVIEKEEVVEPTEGADATGAEAGTFSENAASAESDAAPATTTTIQYVLMREKLNI